MHTAINWKRLAPGLLLLAALLWLMRDTATAMVQIWMRSETFTHAFLVPPIVLWLVWRLRPLLVTLPTRPVPWLLLPMAGICFLWLLGELATVAAASQFALVALIVLAVPALFGWAIARALTFPLMFLFFAVPFGEFTVPALMDWTADFTVLALRASGIPVYREGLDFVIPSGNWSVVEACSGVRYLIASFMVGSLFAYLNYQSTTKRVVFMLISLLVPIIANWLRAYMIVMIGHLSGNELAVGVDHLVYGWVFFGIIIGLMFFIGARWAEPDAELPGPDAAEGVATRPQAGWAVAATIVALVVGTQAWAWRLDHGDAGAGPRLALQASADGWQSDAQASLPWQPAFMGPGTIAQARFSRSSGATAQEQQVYVWTGYYRNQGMDSKLVSSVNTLVDGADRAWSQVESGGRAAADGLPAFRTAVVRQGAQLGGAEVQRLRVWQTYWVGGRWETSDARAKVRQALDKLTGQGDDGAVVLLVTPIRSDAKADADATLETFARQHLGALAAELARARDTR
jgi:exosortase A